VPYCPDHQVPAEDVDVARAAGIVLERLRGQHILITLPQLVGDRQEYLGLRDDLLRQGYRRIVCAEQLTDLDTLKPSAAEKAGWAHVVLDRVSAEPSKLPRIKEALETAFSKSAGALSRGHSW